MKKMKVLDFTNKKQSSTKNAAYFKSWNRIFGQDGNSDNNLSHGRQYRGYGEQLYEVRTTDDSRSFASYFNSVGSLNRKTKWVFGNGNKFITLNEFNLDKKINRSSSIERYGGFFMNNVFELGNGTNTFVFDIDFGGYGTSWINNIKPMITESLREELTQRGYKATINGGNGIDRV